MNTSHIDRGHPAVVRAAGPRRLLALGLAGLLAVAGCSPPTASHRPTDRPGDAGSASAGRRVFPLTGVVEGVDRDAGKVVIRHEAIPEFMDAMTMPFEVDEPGALADVQVGDKIEGRLRVDREGSRLTDVVVVELADPSRLPGARPWPPKSLSPGEEVPDFAMTTQSGETLRLSDLRGKAVVLTFIYTRCPLPEFCPLMDRRFGELALGLAVRGDEADDVRLLSVSFDPEHDTPEVLRAHAAKVGARPPLWTVAVASHDELRRVAGPLGLTYGATGDQVIHSLSTAVIGPDGRLARLWRGRDWTTGDVRRLLKSLTNDRGNDDGMPR
jgi:protein SCO1/2